MLIYVQTTTDVQATMAKIDALDQLLYHGQHKLRIGVTAGAVWPFVWYLHDYQSNYNPSANTWTQGAIYNYVSGTANVVPDVILAGLDGDSTNVSSYYATQFQLKQYRLRWWWDESYKLPQCTLTKVTQCSQQATWGTGDGPFLWLSYGAYPPASCSDYSKPQCDPLNAPFNGALAAQRYWLSLIHI